MIILYTILTIALYNLLINLIRLRATKKYHSQYIDWLDNDRSWEFVQTKSHVIELLKKANIMNAVVPYCEPAGYGQIATGSTNVFTNYPSAREDIATLTMTMFHNAIGIYKRRILNSINPLAWLELIINFPTTVTSYLGIKAKVLWIRFFNILWWVTSGIVSLIVFLYGDQIKEIIKTFLASI